jgi:hypothetical protein
MRAKSRRGILLLGLLLLTIPMAGTQGVRAEGSFQVRNDQASLQFPDSVTFTATIQSTTTITSVILEYGVDQQTCGTVVAKAFPQFDTGQNVNAAWTWEMKQSGSLPPGAKIWWRWLATDTNGNQSSTNPNSVQWLDTKHDWQTVSGEDINLHWYRGGNSLGQELHQAAVDGLQRLEHDAGLSTDGPVDLYIYANTSDMKDAILYEPSWTGGMAFPAYNIVIIGISPDQIDWGKRTEVHELTHVLVGHLTFSCLSDVPTWLDEGLAVYSEGKLEDSSQRQLDQAIQDDTLFSVRSLSGGFSEIPDKADLSYSESYSIVKFLIEQYSRDQMTSLLLALRDGMTPDEALQSVYGFNVDGLESAWRASIGAKPRASTANATPTALPTPVPTIHPISGIPAAEITPYATPPMATPGTAPTQTVATQPGRPPLSLTLTLIFTGCVLLIVFGFIGLAFFMAISDRRRKKDS